MSEQKILNSRITQKIDTTANWEKAINFIPLKGEIIIYQDEGTADRFKIGDGATLVNDLPFMEMGEGTSVTTPIVTTKTIASDLNESLSPAQTIQLDEKNYSFYEMGSSSPTSYLVFEDGFILEEVGAIEISYDDMDAVVENQGEYFSGWCGPAGEDVHISVTLPDELVEKYAGRKLYWSTATVAEETVIENKPISELIAGDNLAIDYDNGKAILSSSINLEQRHKFYDYQQQEITFDFIKPAVGWQEYLDYAEAYGKIVEEDEIIKSVEILTDDVEDLSVNYYYDMPGSEWNFQATFNKPNTKFSEVTIRVTYAQPKEQIDELGSFKTLRLNDGLVFETAIEENTAQIGISLAENEYFSAVAEQVYAQNDMLNELNASLDDKSTKLNTLTEDLKTTQALSSQGRSSKYNITEGPGWYRILNLIRASNGTVTIGFGQSNRPLTNDGCGRSSQALAFDFTGYVWYPGQDKNNIAEDIGKPEFLLKYNNLFGDPNAMEKGMAQITKVRLGYPDVAADDWKNSEEQFDNPVNCFLDVYIDFPNPAVAADDGPEQININYTGYSNSHKTSLIDSCTKVAEDAKGELEGSEYSLKYYTLDIKDMPTSKKDDTVKVGNEVYYTESFSNYDEIIGTDSQKSNLQYNGRYNLLYRGLPADSQSNIYTCSTGSVTYNEDGYYTSEVSATKVIWTDYGYGAEADKTNNNRFYFFSSLAGYPTNKQITYGGVESPDSPMYAPSLFLEPGSYYISKGTCLLFSYGENLAPAFGSYGTRKLSTTNTSQKWQHHPKDLKLSGTIVETDKTLECVGAAVRITNPDYIYEKNIYNHISPTDQWGCKWNSGEGVYTVREISEGENVFGNYRYRLTFTDDSYLESDTDDFTTLFTVGQKVWFNGGADIYEAVAKPTPFVPMLIKREGIFAELASHEINTIDKTVTFKNGSGNVIKTVPLANVQIPLYTETATAKDVVSIYYKPENGTYTTATQSGLVTISTNDNPITIVSKKTSTPVIVSEEIPDVVYENAIWASPAGDTVIERGEGNEWFYEKWFSGYCELYGTDITKDFPFVVNKAIHFTSADGASVQVKGWWK